MHDRRKCLICRSWVDSLNWTRLQTITIIIPTHQHPPTHVCTLNHPPNPLSPCLQGHCAYLSGWSSLLKGEEMRQAEKVGMRETPHCTETAQLQHTEREDGSQLKRWTQFWKLTSSWRVQIATTFTIPHTHHHINWVNRQCLQILAHAPHPLPLYHTQSLCNSKVAPDQAPTKLTWNVLLTSCHFRGNANIYVTNHRFAINSQIPGKVP